MIGVMTLHRSTVGKKVIMAITGIVLIGFIMFHMYGNLKAFWGPAYFNEYSEGLRTVGEPIFGYQHLLWVARLGLIAAFGLHIWSALELIRQRQAGRPVKYVKHTKLEANYANLTIRFGGILILLFLIYHLMHFTFGVPVVHPDFIPGDAYHNLVVGFQSVPVSIAYIIAVFFLGLHLYHGTWSMFQTLGFNSKEYDKPLRVLGLVVALVVTIGFISVPISVMLGIIS